MNYKLIKMNMFHKIKYSKHNFKNNDVKLYNSIMKIYQKKQNNKLAEVIV